MNIVKGNLIDLAERGDFDVIVQGCNCHCTMGSGIAREIRARYPIAYEIDCDTAAGDYKKLGNYTVADVAAYGSEFLIVNAYTQYGFNRPGESTDVFEYDAFRLVLQKLAHQYPTARFGFPMIGMGLAGGNKTRIMGMLAEFSLTITESGGSFTLVEFA